MTGSWREERVGRSRRVFFERGAYHVYNRLDRVEGEFDDAAEAEVFVRLQPKYGDPFDMVETPIAATGIDSRNGGMA